MADERAAVPDNSLRSALRKVGAGPKRSKDLTQEEAFEAAREILAGSAAPAQIGALLIALRVKEESPEELAGFARAVRERCKPFPLPRAPIIDCAGAYDGRVRTVPVGVASALIASRARVHCLFHGLAGLGRGGVGPGDILNGLRNGTESLPGVSYADQADYCPALASLKPLRNQLGLRTAFNTAEKLVGLAGGSSEAWSLIVGVFHGGYLEKLAMTASFLGIPRALVIQGLEGSDDVPVTRDSQIFEVRHGSIERWTVDLAALGIQRAASDSLNSSGLAESLERLKRALEGEPGPVLEALVLNTAIRLYAADKAGTLAEGVVMARGLICRGAGAL